MTIKALLVRSTAAVDVVETILRKDSLRSTMVWIIFHSKMFESETRFMHESLFRLLRVGVCLQMLRPEMWLVPSVAPQKLDGYDALVKIP